MSEHRSSYRRSSSTLQPFIDTEIVSRTIDGAVRRHTYAEAERRSNQLARALLRLGIKPVIE
jgi:hypothetical protein